MATARVYVRLSRDDDASTSLERQEADCRSRAAREGADEIILYAEPPGTSAFSGARRPARDRLFADLRNGDLVVVWAIDRLTRGGSEEAGGLWRRIDDAGARLLSVTDGIDSAQDYSELSLAMRAILAREESKRISTRVKSAKALARADGRLSTWPAWGLRRLPTGKVEPDPVTGPWARQVVERVIEGQSLVEIADSLNAEGITTPRGKPWRQPWLSRWLASPTIAGLATHKGQVILDDDGEPARIGEGVVDQDTYWTMRAALASRSRSNADGTTAGKRRPRALLAGLAVCGICGSNLVLSGGETTRGYRCRLRMTDGAAACRGVTAIAARLDAEVTARWLTYVSNLDVEDPADRAVLVDVFTRWQTVRSPTAPTAELAAVRAAEEAVERLEHLVVDGVLSTDAYLRERARVDARLAAARERLAAMTTGGDLQVIVGDSDTLLEAWEDSPLERRRDLLHAVIAKVIVHPVPRRGGTFDPGRVEVVWH